RQAVRDGAGRRGALAPAAGDPPGRPLLNRPERAAARRPRVLGRPGGGWTRAPSGTLRTGPSSVLRVRGQWWTSTRVLIEAQLESHLASCTGMLMHACEPE